MKNNSKLTTTGAIIAAAAVALAACGSGDTAVDSSASDVPSTTAEPTATAPESTPDTTSAETTPDGNEEPGQIEISTDIQFNIDGTPEGELPAQHGGTFEVTVGADQLGCESGTSVDTDNGPGGVEKLMTCEQGERTGTFSVSFIPFEGPWTITAATDNFDGLGGLGDWDAQILDDGARAQETI